MSEINERENRKNALMDMLLELHAGGDITAMKKRFSEVFEGVSAQEISEVEQELVEGGMPIEEIERLCDVHAAVYNGSIDAMRGDGTEKLPGHPAQILKAENRAIRQLMEEVLRMDIEELKKSDPSTAPAYRDRLQSDMKRLSQINLHYIKKENLLFPYLEKYGVTTPPKVMRDDDDRIRVGLKRLLNSVEGTVEELEEQLGDVFSKIEEMMFTEENIILPMLVEALTKEEWAKIAHEEREMGYCLLEDVPIWISQAEMDDIGDTQETKSGDFRTSTGYLSQTEMEGLLNTLPVDIMFVDAKGYIKYFSDNVERIFTMTSTVLGRKAAECHFAADMHRIDGIIDEFKTGKKEYEDFWMQMNGKYVYIRYFAVKGKDGEYLGTLETAEDIGPLQAITGEKRLKEE